MKKQKIWFITGAGRGFGFEIAKAALASGDIVIATVRNNASELASDLSNNNLTVVTLDITDENQAKELAKTLIEKFGKIDVVFNNAGFGLLGAVEEITAEEVRKLYETNVFGTLNVTRSFLPYLRKQGSGHIINISSVGGLTGSPGWGIYNSTKFAVEGFSEALAKELSPLGIYVTVVEPGYFRTNFLDPSSLNRGSIVIEDYAETTGKMRNRATEINYKQPGDPAKLAAAMVKLVESENPPLHLPMGQDTLDAYEAKTMAFQKNIQDWHSVIIGTSTDQ